MKTGLYYSKIMWYEEIVTKKGFKKVSYGILDIQKKLLNQHLKPSKEKSILEMGCGYGRESQILADMFGEVSSFDINKEVIERAKKYAKNNKKNNIKFITYPDEIHVLKPESYDCLYSYLVMQHCPDNIAELLLLDGSTMLKKGGTFLIEFIKTKLDGQDTKVYPKNPRNGHCNIGRDEMEVKKLFKEANLKIVNTCDIVYANKGIQTWYWGIKCNS